MQSLIAYAWEIKKMTLKNKFLDEYCTSHGKPPSDSMEIENQPHASIGAIFMCDGQPVAQLSSLISVDNKRFYQGLNNNNNTHFDK